MAGEMDEFSLRPLLGEDKCRIRAWRNSDRVRVHMFNPTPISEVDHDQWFTRVLGDDPNRYRILLSGSQPLGFVSFSPVVDAAATWAWGLYVGEPDAPRGSGSALGRLALDHAFVDLGADAVVSEAMISNERALALYSRLGFVRTGTRQVTRLREYGPEDVAIFTISRAAWGSPQATTDGYAAP